VIRARVPAHSVGPGRLPCRAVRRRHRALHPPDRTL
jgi:hypothetical protein